MSKTVPGGLLVVVEGIDGAGKTTLVSSLVAFVRDSIGIAVVASKEPTQGPHGAALRATSHTGRLTPAEELKLLVADRREHVAALIAPALAAGEVVILDRYYYSNMAYQGAEGLSLATIVEANEFAPTPHCVMLLDTSPEIGLARIAARGDRANAFETAANLAAVREIFLQVLPAKPVGQVVDASQSADDVLKAGRECVVAAIADRVRQQLGFNAASAERLRALLYDQG